MPHEKAYSIYTTVTLSPMVTEYQRQAGDFRIQIGCVANELARSVSDINFTITNI